MVQLLVKGLEVRMVWRDGNLSDWYPVLAIDERDHRGRYLIHRADAHHGKLCWVSRDAIADVRYEPVGQEVRTNGDLP